MITMSDLTLRELLSQLPARKRIRVGTIEGSGFFFVGQKIEFAYTKIDKDLREAHAVRIINCLKTMRISRKKHLKSKMINDITASAERYAYYVPIMERRVVEAYGGQADPSVLVILIEGSESGDTDNCSELNPIDTDNLENLVAGDFMAAIYRDPAMQLSKVIHRQEQARKRNDTKKVKSLERTRSKLEESIKSIDIMPEEYGEIVIRGAVKIGKEKGAKTK